MSEIHKSRHIHIPTEAENLADLDYAQRLAYMSFYSAITHPNYLERQKNLRELWQDRPDTQHQPLLHNIYKTAMNTLYVVGWTKDAHDHPDDHLLAIAELRGGEMQVDYPEIQEVHFHHLASGAIHKIIDAKWHETSRLTSIEFGSGHASLVEDGPLGLAYPPIKIVDHQQPGSRFSRRPHHQSR